MLTPPAYRRLAVIPSTEAFAIRAICYLLGVYDMHRFVAVEVDRIVADLESTPAIVRNGLRELCAIGILETTGKAGRVYAKDSGRLVTLFRVSPAYWLDEMGRGKVAEECRTIRERETLLS